MKRLLVTLPFAAALASCGSVTAVSTPAPVVADAAPTPDASAPTPKPMVTCYLGFAGTSTAAAWVSQYVMPDFAGFSCLALLQQQQGGAGSLATVRLLDRAPAGYVLVCDRQAHQVVATYAHDDPASRRIGAMDCPPA